MSVQSARAGAEGDLLALYDVALPQVYGYLLRRCGTQAVAEDLTAETFLAAVDATRRPDPPAIDVAWLIGTARHKLVDHWRRLAREDRNLRAVEAPAEAEDPWDATLDALTAQAALERLGPHHRAALTLRYLDDLTVPQVAAALGRTRHATEALIVRARAAFRSVYEQTVTGKEVDRG
ncbi:RNA polymerase sigma factor [Sporichthya polymorpha]|uniref:RNA polymerase sigma factor n=1 Tax=Sporichthya polymorpha TaxID=35751 RepID=UPI000380A295|nr:sigma-70 family RNA polymerase sigma factor [Sporichthya polymorpha]